MFPPELSTATEDNRIRCATLGAAGPGCPYPVGRALPRRVSLSKDNAITLAQAILRRYCGTE